MSLGAVLRARGMLLEVGVYPWESRDWRLESKGQRPGRFVRVNYHDLTGTHNSRETDVSLDYLGWGPRQKHPLFKLCQYMLVKIPPNSRSTDATFDLTLVLFRDMLKLFVVVASAARLYHGKSLFWWSERGAWLPLSFLKCSQNFLRVCCLSCERFKRCKRQP